MAQLVTLLQAVNTASIELGISQQAAVQALGSLDEDVAQMTSLLSAVADELLLEEPYRDLLGDGNWLVDINGVYQASPTADTNRILFDGRLAINGIKYRFLQAKGLEFGEQMRDFINRQNKIAYHANQRVLDLDMEEDRDI